MGNSVKKKRIGLFGGSFDPIHLGHLNLAINLLEQCSLDQVLFCPTTLSPFKTETPAIAAIEHRLEMIRRTIDPIDAFALLDWEAKSGDGGPTYTIDTVRALAQDPSQEVYLLIGEDHLDALHRWKDSAELIRLAPPLVASREVSKPAASPLEVTQIKIPLYEISSTEIRERLLEKKYCGHLVPALALDYIYQNQLYC